MWREPLTIHALGGNKMRTLEFIVNGQKLTKNGDFSGLVAGSSGYLKLHSMFSDDWDDCVIAASFWINDEEFPVILNEHKECMVPDDVTSQKKFQVSFSGVKSDGSYTITTNKLKIYQGE